MRIRPKLVGRAIFAGDERVHLKPETREDHSDEDEIKKLLKDLKKLTYS